MLLLTTAPSAADQASAPPTFVISDRTPDCLLEREGQLIDDAALKELAERYGRREVDRFREGIHFLSLRRRCRLPFAAGRFHAGDLPRQVIGMAHTLSPGGGAR
ncbi:hypothetical protein [Sphingomonas paucimobilis]|uniref:hypothetical protein n=1 Tax=Sphingomonas paucimobilis TaxID=13689 RepID=UPI0028D675AF|nr:hypothetical protein [Sphingomonas paucimobilis]